MSLVLSDNVLALVHWCLTIHIISFFSVTTTPTEVLMVLSDSVLSRPEKSCFALGFAHLSACFPRSKVFLTFYVS